MSLRMQEKWIRQLDFSKFGGGIYIPGSPLDAHAPRARTCPSKILPTVLKFHPIRSQLGRGKVLLSEERYGSLHFLVFSSKAFLAATTTIKNDCCNCCSFYITYAWEFSPIEDQVDRNTVLE